MAAPFVLGFALFYIVPYGAVFYYAFSSQDVPAVFSGLENFSKVWQNEYFRLALSNTAIFALLSIPLLVAISYMVANVLNGQKSRLARALLFLPVLAPSASIAGLWGGLFSPGAIFPIYLLFVWKNIGLISLVITAGLSKLPPEVYDAAAIDGANTFLLHRHIILPMLSPVLFFCFLVGLIQSFKIFREIYLIYSAYPPEGLYMIQHFIFNKFNKLDYAELSAGTVIFAGAVVALIAALLFLGNMLFLKKKGRGA